MSSRSARSSRQRAILYITYDGILEPLGESQVLQYLRHLASDYRIVLVSYEKPGDWADRDRRARARALLREAGIYWVPLRYHHRPTGPATAYDLAVGLLVACFLVVRDHIGLVHTRSYVPAVLGLAVKHLFGVRFLFDMRGFWADERVEAGIWPRGSRLYRLAKWFERQFLLQADAVVSLTQVGAATLRELPYLRDYAPPVVVIPTCTDLEAFHPPKAAESPVSEPARPFTLGYVGNAGLWYRFDTALSCFAALLEVRPDSRLVVVNRGQHEYIRERVAAVGLPVDRVTVKSAEYAEVPAEMRQMDAGVFFIRPTFAKRASAPTKLGEFLGCGVPCLTNAGVGDVDRILDGGGVGVVLRGLDPVDVRAGIRRLLALVADSRTPARCRRVAEQHFDLQVGIARYRRLYAGLLGATGERDKNTARTGPRPANPNS